MRSSGLTIIPARNVKEPRRVTLVNGLHRATSAVFHGDLAAGGGGMSEEKKKKKHSNSGGGEEK